MKSQLVILLIISFNILSAQTKNTRLLEGVISYISSQNIYVKFVSTNGIEIGDTLFLKNNNDFLPAIKVDHKSSTSCAGSSIISRKLEINDLLYAIIPEIIKDSTTEAVISTTLTPVVIPTVTSGEIITKTTLEPVSSFSGKISVQSYYNFTNNQASYDYQRWRYTFQLNANRIGSSGFSYSQYISFAYRADDWNRISSDLSEAIRVYDLAVKYNFNERTLIWLGRHLNNKISNISSIDGLQFESGINEWSIGAAIGSRPDFNNMGYNFKLFEYGVYANRTDQLANGDMQNTLGYFEQTNDFKTDRRFLYYQHSNSAIQSTRIFLSTEIDLYKKEMGESKTEFSLTSLFTSVNIRPSDFFAVMISYDARKNVIYYETFKTLVDSIIENETRQGFRTRLTLKPFNNFYIGGDYGYRHRKGDLKPSNNYGGYITYTRIPAIETSATVSFNKLSSSYTEGDIWTASLNRPIAFGFDVMLGYRFTNYKFRSGIDDLKQNSVSINLNTYFLKPVLLNFTYEGIFWKSITSGEDVQSSGRFLANLTYRF
ncbi:MAG: hypothetical protein JETCAE03_26460 [Ignavibacteriaceae bacterium]|nr:MAG: hypothetical protein JETCAE03_26460 [Ignavibacteriaceae bacterium]